MELAKDHAPFFQGNPYYNENDFGEGSVHALHGIYGIDHEHHKKGFEKGSSSEKSTSTGLANQSLAIAMSSTSSLSSPSSTNSDGLVYPVPALKYGPDQEAHNNSVISFKAGYAGSFLSFDQNDRFPQKSFPRIISNQQDEYSMWEDINLQHNYSRNQLNSGCSSPNRLQSSSNFASTSNGAPFGWLQSSEANANATMNNSIQDLERKEISLNKRPYMGENAQALKKQCTDHEVTKALKSKSKDPQSIAAKNRRERISERLKILQDLVPNGSKVDSVTMLEKAISYVKFLQLQVKVLATDEFWPAQGGKAPDLSQVREAIDAILASQRHRN